MNNKAVTQMAYKHMKSIHNCIPGELQIKTPWGACRCTGTRMTDTGRGAAHIGGLGSTRAHHPHKVTGVTASISSTAVFYVPEWAELRPDRSLYEGVRRSLVHSRSDTQTNEKHIRRWVAEHNVVLQPGRRLRLITEGNREEPETHSGSGERQTEKDSQRFQQSSILKKIISPLTPWEKWW